jgi:hypothetical protein
MLSADDDKLRGASLAGSPGAVKIAVEARANGLNQKPGGCPTHIGEALDAQDVMSGDGLFNAPQQVVFRGLRPECDDEADEVVVVVLDFSPSIS